jgi:hypothetical protein
VHIGVDGDERMILMPGMCAVVVVVAFWQASAHAMSAAHRQASGCASRVVISAVAVAFNVMACSTMRPQNTLSFCNVHPTIHRFVCLHQFVLILLLNLASQWATQAADLVVRSHHHTIL